MRLFGFEIKRSPVEDPPTFAPPQNDDGAVLASAFGAYGTVVDLDGTVRNEAELISKYREMAMQPEIDAAIEEIVTETVINEDNQDIVKMILKPNSLPPKIEDIMQEEFESILRLLEFNTRAYDIVKRYYIDGRLYYHMMVDEKNSMEGIKELRYIDPRKIRKVREIQKIRDKSNPDVVITRVKQEYYIFNEAGFNAKGAKSVTTIQTSSPAVQGLKISKDSIVQVVSGAQDAAGSMVLSYLHKAIKVMNQLRAIEDASVIYRLSRAPERRIFYIDVGNLPKAKAEQHLRDMMVKHKNKLVYDASTGEVADSRRFMTMLEDYWLPRRGDGKATEITTLPAGQNLGEMTDVEYFKKKLYQSLNVPITRLDPERGVSIGRAAEITRDEIKFSRFIDRIRTRFADLFLIALEKQLVLKMIIAPEEWDQIKPLITFKFARDTHFSELKDSEIMAERMARMREVDPYVGRYYSNTWIRKNILKQTDEDIEQIDAEIAAEMEIPQYNAALMAPPMMDPNNPQPPMMPGPMRTEERVYLKSQNIDDPKYIESKRLGELDD